MKNKFQQTAIYFQEQSSTIQEAVEKFKVSCKICVSRGIKIDCEQCPVKAYHIQTVAVIEDLIEFDRMKREQKELEKTQSRENLEASSSTEDMIPECRN